ncbi:ferritin family protein [Mangrovicoccus sp. HB161399]|uniref:ferritin family protein n=1 Tax=Mangrovicoccus sp. HB161399 TaxID=2720392 RepID=UPI001552CEFE|nr:ferritin family protein [Mangrovicoccus sp. HB161399]
MKPLRTLLLGTIAASPLAGCPVLAGNALDPQTVENLQTAMHGEAFANLKYLAYSEFARRNDNPELAALFAENANVEANEHFDREADALGLVAGNEADLLDAMAGEHYENTVMYVRFADEAAAAGDMKVADMFRQIAADEGDHYASYKAALDKLKAAE